jgi:hypothetical protein
MAGDNQFLISPPGGPSPRIELRQPETYGFSGAMEDLDRAIGRMEEEIHILASVLSPIQRPEGDDRVKDPGDTMGPVSDVANRVYRQGAQVNHLAYTLRMIRERIDL